MKHVPWVLGGIGFGIGVGIAYMIFTQSRPDYATGYDSVEDAAEKTFNWGTKQRIKAKKDSFMGAIKEGVGRLTGDADLADEGAGDSLTGAAKDAAGHLGHAVGQTIHDMNI
jgi:uncharacterized protein YjbJ (UPF0337 family)